MQKWEKIFCGGLLASISLIALLILCFMALSNETFDISELKPGILVVIINFLSGYFILPKFMSKTTQQRLNPSIGGLFAAAFSSYLSFFILYLYDYILYFSLDKTEEIEYAFNYASAFAGITASAAFSLAKDLDAWLLKHHTKTNPVDLNIFN
ncbi:hypothetical protein [Kiloniella majae]|uniref:hypothetical protein n=1 Tax=Kiloniella majae TaxID=1938558 RepID=UPI0015C4F9E3|nr:hypothetical protein [Kiloniella majae]